MITLFEIAQVVGKVLFYIAISSLVGTLSICILESGFRGNPFLIIRQYGRFLTSTLILGIIGTVIFFFAQVGAFAESGWGGMFDKLYLQLIWESGVGDASLLRAILLFIALVAIVLSYKLNNSRVICSCSTIALLFSILGLAFSFTLFGHTAELSWSIKLMLMVHITAMAWWMGALWPLYRSCERLKPNELYRLMHRFGRSASVIVSLLILAGFVLFYIISEFSMEALLQPYGIIFLIKLFLVLALLLLAARHKLSLVPKLSGGDQDDFIMSKQKLRRSIGVEMVIASFVLVVTSVFTTLVSPLH